jgi:hypothetical protein
MTSQTRQCEFFLDNFNNYQQERRRKNWNIVRNAAYQIFLGWGGGRMKGN